MRVVSGPAVSVVPPRAHGVAAGAARGALAAAVYGPVLLLAMWLLEAGDPLPPGESGYAPVSPGLVALWAVLVPSVALAAGCVGLVLGALSGAALSPLVVRLREQAGPLAAAVGVAVTAAGSWLLRDLNVGGTLTEVERVLLLAVLPSSLGGAAASWHVLRAAGAARGQGADLVAAGTPDQDARTVGR